MPFAIDFIYAADAAAAAATLRYFFMPAGYFRRAAAEPLRCHAFHDYCRFTLMQPAIFDAASAADMPI